MKKIIPLILTLLLTQNVNAQLLKKLKDKVENKVEKVKKKKQNKKNKQEEETAVTQNTDDSIESKTFGNATITGPNHGPVTIREIAQPTVTISTEEGKTRVSAWWVTHGTDSYDLFDFTINQVITETSEFPMTFRIPTNADLTIYYDGLLGAYLSDEDWQRKADPEFKLVHNDPDIVGTLTITELNKESINFSFSGSGFSGEVTASSPVWKTEENQVQETKPEKKTVREPNFSPKKGKPGIYKFDVEIATVVTSSDGESYPISYVLSKTEDYYGMMADMSEYDDGEMEGTSVIVLDNNETRVFIDAPMMKMQMNQEMAGAQGNQMPEMGNYDYAKPRKTGKTKQIIGYTCYEYVVEHEGSKVSFWAAPDVEIPNWMFGNKNAVQQTGVLGFVLEFTVTDASGITKSKVTKIDENFNLKIDASEYQKMF